MSDSKVEEGNTKRVACTHETCQNAGLPGQTVPVPGPNGRTISVSLMWTLAGLVGEKAVGEARCYWHKREGDMSFPVEAQAPLKASRPSTTPRFQAPAPMRPRSALPTVAAAARPQAAPTLDARPGSRPRAPEPKKPAAARPQAPHVSVSAAVRPKAPDAPVSQTQRPKIEVSRAEPVSRPVPAARFVAEPVSTSRTPAPKASPPRLTTPPRPHRSSRTTLASVGFDPVAFGEVWAQHKAKKALKRGRRDEAKLIARIERRAWIDGEFLTDVVEASIAPLRKHMLPAGVPIETQPVWQNDEEGYFFRRNASPVSMPEEDLETPVGEMPEPRLFCKVEMRDETPWLIVRDSLDDPEPWCLQMFRAIDSRCRRIWGYYDQLSGKFIMGRFSDRSTVSCVRHMHELGLPMLVADDEAWEGEEIEDMWPEPTTWRKFKNGEEDRPFSDPPKAWSKAKKPTETQLEA